MPAKKAMLIYCTTPDQLTAQKIAKHLLSLKLIACANVFPTINSYYEWNHELKEEHESLFISKTRASLYASVEIEIKKIHPYECPCIVGIELKNIHSDFLKWIFQQTSS